MATYETYNGIRYRILVNTQCDNHKIPPHGCMWETTTDRDKMIWICPKCGKRLGLSCHTTIKQKVIEWEE